MSERDYLPSFKRGAPAAAEISTAILETVLSALGVPGGSMLSVAVRRMIEKRVREAQELLVAELGKGDLRPLSDPEVEEFIPIGFRFFQAARDGEARHILETLAKIVRGEIVQADIRANEFQRCAQQLAGLSPQELQLVAAFATGGASFRLKPDGVGFTNKSFTKPLIKKLVPGTFASEQAFQAACSLLAGRGLLAAHVVQNIDDLTLDYAATADLVRIWKLASKPDESQGANNARPNG